MGEGLFDSNVPVRLSAGLTNEVPTLWEYRLTRDLLKEGFEPVLEGHTAITTGLFRQNSKVISSDEALTWLSAKIEDVSGLCESLSRLTNDELFASWGAPGEAGDERKIRTACALLCACARNLAAWEEEVRFSRVPRIFEPARELMVGIAGRQLLEIAKLPEKLSLIVDHPDLQGDHEIKLVFSLPEGWEDQYQIIIDRCASELF